MVRALESRSRGVQEINKASRDGDVSRRVDGIDGTIQIVYFREASERLEPVTTER